jgi:hypothetical protein
LDVGARRRIHHEAGASTTNRTSRKATMLEWLRAHATSHRERGDITMAKKAAKGAKKKGGKKR